MFMLRVISAGALVVWGALAAGITSGDARRGEQLFQSEQCIQCHNIKGKGGTIAPDLTRRVDRNFTPSVMASLMWNHAPDMWAAMEKQGVKKGNMTPEKAADLFAYFVSARGIARIAMASPVHRSPARRQWRSGNPSRIR